MDLYICDENLNVVAILDQYTSLIWTERYNRCGDFQVKTSYDESLFQAITNGSNMQHDSYLMIRESNSIMLIEEVTVITDAEAGPELEFKGRSLESIIDRRIVYDQTVLDASVDESIHKIFNQNIISPKDPARQFPNFVYLPAEFETIQNESSEEETEQTQYFGNNIYDVVVNVCGVHGLGFRIQLDDGVMTFQLYKGLDRSYNQSERPRVIFSPRFENLLNSNYVESVSDYRNVAIIVGEGEEIVDCIVTEVSREEETGVSGFNRREVFIDGSGISQEYHDEDGWTMTMSDEEYTAELKNKALEELTDMDYRSSFDGEIESGVSFIYGQDYYLGDIVQIENEHGMTAEARVTEFIRSYDENGYKEYPTFESV